MLRSIFDTTTNIPTIIQFFDDMFGNHNEFENVFHPQSTIDPSLNTFSSSTGLLQSFFKAIKNNVQIGQQFLDLLQIPSSDEKYVVIFSHNDGSTFTFSKTNQQLVPIKSFVSHAYDFNQVELIMFILYHFINKSYFVQQYQSYIVGVVNDNHVTFLERF